MMRRVLLTDRAWPDWSVEREILAAAGAEILEAPDGREETLLSLAPEADAIGTCWARVTDRVIRAAPRCRVVARFGIGLDNIAVSTATELGIPVTNVPDYCVPEVAEHTLAMALDLARNVGFFHLRTKRGEYRLASGPEMHRLAGRTIGLIGFGRIGQAVWERARAFRMKGIAWSRSGRDHSTACLMRPLEDLLAQSDVISLHVPLSDETHRLLGPAQFARMKPGAFLINTSRGGLIDHDTLFAAIQSGRLGGAALDVFDPEPPDLTQPLYKHERVIVTPHAAFLSAESLIELRTRAARQIATVLTGGRPENIVNG